MKERLIALLRWSEKYTKTDMVYLASGGSWLVLGQAGSVLLGLATAIAFGHYAGQDTYGNYKYVLSLAGLFSAFSLSGIGIAVTQAVARGYEGSLAQGFRLSIRWSWGVVLLCLGTAAYYYFFAHNTFLGASLLIVALLLPFLNGFSLFDDFLVGKRQFARNVVCDFLNAFFPVAAVIASLFFTHRAILIILTYFVTNALADGLFYLLTLRQTKNAATDPTTFSYSGHLSIMGIINAIADKIDSIVVFTLLGPAQLAVYTFATAMPEQIKFLTKFVTPLALPRFAERKLSEIRRNLWRRVWTLTAVIAAIVGAYVIAAPWLFSLLFPVYIGSVWYSQIYALSIIFNAFIALFLSVFQAHKRTKDLYIVSNFSSVLLIIILPVLTYEFGMLGAIISQFIFRLVGAGLTVWRFMRMRE